MKRTSATPIQTHFYQTWGQLLFLTVTRPSVTDYTVNARYTNSKRKEAKEIFRSLLAVCTEARFGLHQHVTWGTEMKRDKKKKNYTRQVLGKCWYDTCPEHHIVVSIE